MVALLTGGWTFVNVVTGAGGDLERANLLSDVTIAATSFEFDLDELRNLKGSKEDSSSPVFAAVRDKLKHIRRHIPEARFIYLMGQRGGAVFFLADAEEPASPDYSPPGQAYPEASPTLLRVFSAAVPMIESPYHDRWGDWVSGLAPVTDSATGKVLAVLGIDIPASHWNQQIERYGLVAALIVGLFAAVFGTALFFQARSQRRIAVLNIRLKAEVDELAKSNRIVENSSTVLFRMTASPSWPLSYVSHNIDRYGYGADALSAPLLAWTDLCHPDDTPSMREDLDELQTGKTGVIHRKRRFKKQDNSWAWVDVSLTPVRDETGHLLAVEGIMSDISDTKNAEDRIAHAANHDGLTGLLSRAAFMDRLRLAFAAARRRGNSFAVLYLDIDHFKDINDTFGHKNGDLFLQMVSDRLSATLREVDALGHFSVARFGGDEFAILETDVTDPSDAGALAQRLVKTLAEPFKLDSSDIHATVSIGISLYDGTIAEANDLLMQADLALYRAKEAGRDQFHFHSADLDAKVRERVAIGEELHNALKNGELELYYQPQVETPSGKITGVEALMRWNHPTRGMVSPGQFIPIAEKTGVIAAMGTWAIEEACGQVERWRAEGIAVPSMGVNVSAVQFRNPAALLAVVENALRRWDIGRGVLELELTESLLIEATEAHSDTLDRLREIGVRIAIDDFGTGYSSLEYLHAYPIDRLKIAQQFMRRVPGDAGDNAIVKATVDLANALKLDIIAEGVETREQLDFLSKAGCRTIQGYYFSRPVPAKAAAQILSRGILDFAPAPGDSSTDRPTNSASPPILPATSRAPLPAVA